jgi:hypothetical protein
MFDFLEKIMQPMADSFMKNKEYLIAVGIATSLIWLYIKNARRQEMKKLAKEMDMPFKSYAIKWELLPKLTPLVYGNNPGFPINFMEGKFNGCYNIIFDFNYTKRSLFSDNNYDKLITYVNGKYFKNCSVPDLKEAISTNNFSNLALGDEINEYLRYRDIAVLSTYGNVRLENNDVSLKDVERVLNAFRSINYGSFAGRLQDGMLMNKLNADIGVEKIENKLKSWGANITSDNIGIIYNEYLNILHLHNAGDILKEINLNKLK